ncbi:hypothetical protein H6234_001367 [Enterococcus hirae]|nr:hypothetical protein [Enterococcus hirae]
MEKLNKKNKEKVSVQSKNQRGIFYRLKDRLKLNKKNGKKVIVQAEDQPSLAYELTNKYKLEKNKSDDMKALVALGKDLSKYDPATIEGILFYLPLTPEKKNLFQPRNRIVQPEDQQSHASRLTNKYELKMERTNPEKFAKLGRELSRYDLATIEGILLHLPLIPEEKDLLQPRNRIVQPEDQLELADRLIDKYKLKNKHTNLKTMAALGKDLSKYDPDSTEGILLHLPLIPEEKKQLKPRNRIVQPEDQLELAYRITKKYKLKHQHTNLKTFVALGKDLSRYDPDSTEGILLHLPLIPEEKNLLQPRNRIVKPEDRLELADRLTDKYNLKMECTDPVTFAKLDRELSKYDSDSTKGILLHLPLIPEEKKLLQPRNRIVKPENQPNLAYRLTKMYKLKNQHTNVKTLVALGKELSKYDPDSTEGILLLLPLIPEEKNLLQPRNRIAQPKDQPALAYELMEEKKQSTNTETLVALDKDLSKGDPTSSEGNISDLPLIPEEKNLLQQRTIEMESIDRTFFIDYLNEQHNLNSNTPLSEKTKAALIEDLDKFYYLPLKPSTCYNFISDLHIINRDDVYELLNDQIPKVNELITQVINNATLAITNKYQLLENQSVPKEKLETIATEILDLNLGEEQEREVIAKLEISKEDRATLEEIYREKRDLLQTQESQKDAEIKAATLAITNTYELSVEKTTPQEKLKAIANELINRNLSTLQEHEIIYLLEIETKDRDTLRTIYKELKKIQESQKDANVKAVTIAFTNIYKLSEDQPNSQNNLKAIAKTIMDLDLSDEQKREVILELEIPKKDKDTLRKMYTNELEKNLNGERIATAISSKYQLSVEKTTPQEKLNTIAKEITKLNLSDEQKREVILKLKIPEKNKTTLREMYSNELEKNLNGERIATAISSKYQLSVEKTTPQEKLNTIAKKITKLDLSDEQKREVIRILEIPEKDQDTLREMYLNKFEEKLNWKIVTKAIDISSKYQLSVEKTTPQEKLKAIANELIDLNLSKVQEKEKEIIHLLEIETEDRDTLRTIYKELKKIQVIKKVAPLAITTKYELSEDQSNSPEKLNKTAKKIANLDLTDEQKREVILELKIPEKDRDTLLSIYEEQKKVANIAIIKKYQPTALYDLKEIAKHIANERRNNVKKKSTESEQLFQQNVNAVATTITNKHQLSENRPATSNKLHRIANEVVYLNFNIEQKLELMRTLTLAKADKDKLLNIFSNSVINDKIVSLLAETIKVNYQLSENKTTSPKDLHEIAITIENSYLDEKYMDTLSDNLVMRIEEKEALRDIIRERAKQQTDKKQENEADIKINGKTIAEVVDDNALLLSRAMNTALALKENQKVEPKMLSTMAEFIGSRKLNEINRRNIPYMLTLTNEDKKELNEIINGKTTLLSKLPELDRTNPNPIDQVPLPLNQRLSNRGSEQNTLPKPNKNIKQMNSLSQGSAEVSR